MVSSPVHSWWNLWLNCVLLQASESGSVDDTQSQVLEWQEMVTEAVIARDQAKEEKASMALRISHMEEEREGEAAAAEELQQLIVIKNHTGMLIVYYCTYCIMHSECAVCAVATIK